ncbi:hypothetical protein BDV35DRAFT_354372, partial [Aspergillus flavus]
MDHQSRGTTTARPFPFSSYALQGSPYPRTTGPVNSTHYLGEYPRDFTRSLNLF